MTLSHPEGGKDLPNALRSHRGAIIGMYRQLIRVDVLFGDRLIHELCGELKALVLLDSPVHNPPGVDVLDHIELPVDPLWTPELA